MDWATTLGLQQFKPLLDCYNLRRYKHVNKLRTLCPTLGRIKCATLGTNLLKAEEIRTDTRKIPKIH